MKLLPVKKKKWAYVGSSEYSCLGSVGYRLFLRTVLRTACFKSVLRYEEMMIYRERADIEMYFYERS